MSHCLTSSFVSHKGDVSQLSQSKSERGIRFAHGYFYSKPKSEFALLIAVLCRKKQRKPPLLIAASLFLWQGLRPCEAIFFFWIVLQICVDTTPSCGSEWEHAQIFAAFRPEPTAASKRAAVRTWPEKRQQKPCCHSERPAETDGGAACSYFFCS